MACRHRAITQLAEVLGRAYGVVHALVRTSPNMHLSRSEGRNV